jgi:diguanylate cyclase (GGDEF)-like protein
MALLFIDLDHFKEINDTLGHEAGDSALKEVSQRLSSVIEDRDMLARLSGDEFTILRMDILDVSEVSILAENILKILRKPIILENKKIHLSASIGISLLPEDGEDARTLLKCADTAMYRAKTKGKNQFRFYLEPNE